MPVTRALVVLLVLAGSGCAHLTPPSQLGEPAPKYRSRYLVLSGRDTLSSESFVHCGGRLLAETRSYLPRGRTLYEVQLNNRGLPTGIDLVLWNLADDPSGRPTQFVRYRQSGDTGVTDVMNGTSWQRQPVVLSENAFPALSGDIGLMDQMIRFARTNARDSVAVHFLGTTGPAVWARVRQSGDSAWVSLEGTTVLVRWTYATGLHEGRMEGGDYRIVRLPDVENSSALNCASPALFESRMVREPR
jgi:hypothetical protein